MARTKQTARSQRVRVVTFTLSQQTNAAAAYRDFHNIPAASPVASLYEVGHSSLGFGGWARDFIRNTRKTLVASKLFYRLPEEVVNLICSHIQETLPPDSRFD